MEGTAALEIPEAKAGRRNALSWESVDMEDTAVPVAMRTMAMEDPERTLGTVAMDWKAGMVDGVVPAATSNRRALHLPVTAATEADRARWAAKGSMALMAMKTLYRDNNPTFARPVSHSLDDDSQSDQR